MGPREHDADAGADLLDVDHDRADAVADVVVLAANPLAAGEDGLAVPEGHDDVVALEPDDLAADELALPRLVLAEERRLLGLADLLDDDLLGGLGRDAAEIRGGQLLAVAERPDVARGALDLDGDFVLLGIS